MRRRRFNETKLSGKQTGPETEHAGCKDHKRQTEPEQDKNKMRQQLWLSAIWWHMLLATQQIINQ